MAPMVSVVGAPPTSIVYPATADPAGVAARPAAINVVVSAAGDSGGAHRSRSRKHLTARGPATRPKTNRHPVR
jgi:hypothetical protein